MTGGTILAILLVAAAAAFVIAPLLRRDAAEAERRSATLSRARELDSRREQLLASIRDLEDDRVTDKLDEADYTALRARLESEAIAVLRELDETEQKHEAEVEAARRASQPIPHPGAARPDRR